MATYNDARTVHNIGSAPVVEVDFTADDVAADPSAVSFQTIDPDDVLVSYTDASPEVTNPTVGRWELQLPALTKSGVWKIRAAGTATVVAVDIGELYVEPDEFNPGA